MFPLTDTRFREKVENANDKAIFARATMSYTLVPWDFSRFVSSFGKITRSLEYDTGKFTTSSHSMKIENTKEFGEYLFTLRNEINAKPLPGYTYWTDLLYRIYWGYWNEFEITAGNNPEQGINLYQGKITSKTEDRVNDTVSISSNDIMKDYINYTVAKKTRTKDFFFDYVHDEADNQLTLQEYLRYGVHDLRYTNTLQNALPVSCSWAGTINPWCMSAVTTGNHGLEVGSEVIITGTSNYNGTFQVYRVVSATEVWICFNDSGHGVETGTLSIYTQSEARSNYETPFSVVPCISNTYLAVPKGYTGGVEQDITHVYVKPGAVNTIYYRVATPWEPGTKRFVVKDTTDYNGKFLGFNMGGNITAVANQGGNCRFTISVAFPPTGDNYPVRISGCTNTSYNVDTTWTYVDATHMDSTITYISDDTGTYLSRDMIDNGPQTYTSDQTGHLYYLIEDVGYLWYVPTSNKILDHYLTSLNKYYYWDYIINKWCPFNHFNWDGTPDLGFEVVEPTDTTIPGVYLVFKATGRINDNDGEHKWDWVTQDDWSNYINGDGVYWKSSQPKPKIAVGGNFYATVGGADYLGNPATILYDLLTSSHIGLALTAAQLDFSSFASPTTTHSFDVAYTYYGSSKVSVQADEEATISAIIEQLALTAGLNFVVSSIRDTDDHRVRVTVNRAYSHATDEPVAALSFSTVNDLTALTIDSNSDKLKDKIIISNFVPTTDIKETKHIITVGTGLRELEINLDDGALVFWYDATSMATTIATNYYDRLSNAWEDIKATINQRGVIIDPGDYVKFYDHKVNEYIVGQVFNWGFDLDSGIVDVSCKKVWSSKDAS